MLVVVILYFEVDLFENLSLIITVNFNPFFYLYTTRWKNVAASLLVASGPHFQNRELLVQL